MQVISDEDRFILVNVRYSILFDKELSSRFVIKSKNMI